MYVSRHITTVSHRITYVSLRITHVSQHVHSVCITIISCRITICSDFAPYRMRITTYRMYRNGDLCQSDEVTHIRTYHNISQHITTYHNEVDITERITLVSTFITRITTALCIAAYRGGWVCERCIGWCVSHDITNYHIISCCVVVASWYIVIRCDKFMITVDNFNDTDGRNSKYLCIGDVVSCLS